MHIVKRAKGPAQWTTLGLVLLGIVLLGMTSCKSSYHPTRRTDPNLDPGFPKGNDFFHQASYSEVRASLPEVADAEYVNDDELCLTCHEAYTKTFAQNVHHGVKAGEGENCEACHGPASRHLETRGKEPGLIFNFKKAAPAVASEVCLKCHEENQCVPGARFRVSKHAHCGVTCIDCHSSHYNVPPGTPATTEPGETAMDGAGNPINLASYADDYVEQSSLSGTSNNLGAVAPGVCYRCHCDKQVYQEIAGPHQICGVNGFNCTTCHDPHGKILESSRVDLCLQCHKEGSPTMAFHSSIHNLEGVACADCHNPHPRTDVPNFVNISHTDIRRPRRRMMSVEQPETCYKCHPNIYGLASLPSHHPIKEGNILCCDCHDPHGQQDRNIKADKVNELCYKCHAEKQGPFLYEHPPVTENCTYCHNPHGAVANNLLKQPPPFLCLRCHSGHRGGPGFHDDEGSGYLPDFASNPSRQVAFYTDCTQCHTQIHGSNVPTPHAPRALMR